MIHWYTGTWYGTWHSACPCSISLAPPPTPLSLLSHIVRTPAGLWLVLRSVPMNIPTIAATRSRANIFASSGEGAIDLSTTNR